MKTLYLVRHAKSSWDYPDLKDSDRPLNKRGKRDAPFMAKLMRNNKEAPDIIVSSPAVRAYEIAKEIAKGADIDKKDIIKDERLYMADTDDFTDVIKETKNKYKNLMLVGHNYGITYFANKISDADIDNIPTSGIVRIDFKADDWKEVAGQKGNMIFFEYPKKYSDGD